MGNKKVQVNNLVSVTYVWRRRRGCQAFLSTRRCSAEPARRSSPLISDILRSSPTPPWTPQSSWWPPHAFFAPFPAISIALNHFHQSRTLSILDSKIARLTWAFMISSVRYWGNSNIRHHVTLKKFFFKYIPEIIAQFFVLTVMNTEWKIRLAVYGSHLAKTKSGLGDA